MSTENNKQGFEFDPKQNESQQTNHAESGKRQSNGYQGSQPADQPAQAQYAKQQPVTTMQQPLPNSGGILAMGIISLILFCCCYGVISIVLAIIALVLASKAQKEYMQNPDLYTISSYKNMRAGRVTAIIGLCLAGLVILGMIILLISGINVLSSEEAIREFEQAWESTGY